MSLTGERRADLLVAGGARDPNLVTLAAAAAARGLSVIKILHDTDDEPAISWDYATGSFSVDGKVIKPRSAFVRYDVFTPSQSDDGALSRAQAWYSTVVSWLQTERDITFFNRDMHSDANTKGAVLARAAAAGFDIPQGIVTNEKVVLDRLAGEGAHIVKPSAGGAYTMGLEEATQEVEWINGTAPTPVFAQERLAYPEYRVFIISGQRVVYRIESDHLDHRVDRASSVVAVEESVLPTGLGLKLAEFADTLGLDWCAFDLKSRESDGSLCLLEVNSGPMFSGFDLRSNGQLIAVMLDQLTRPGKLELVSA